MNNKKCFLIVVAGPTAVGKTGIAIKLAQHFNTEILSADARQFYREMSIGTAKPSEKELAAVPHHFINSLSIKDEYNVGRFETDALNSLNKLFEKHEVIVMVGGSGLFIRAVCEGLDELPGADLAIRNELEDLLRLEGIETLQKLLKQKDPEYYSVIDTDNPRRVLRALEVCISTGKPFSSFLSKQSKQRNFTSIKIGLNIEREKLYAQINHRVDEMIKQGLEEEVKNLFPFRDLNALQTVGYTELFEYIEGKITLPEAIEQIKQHTRNYAKRQLTWFRKEKDMEWFEPEEWEKVVKLVEARRSKIV